MVITDDHWLEGATRDAIAGGSPMAIRRCLVEHFTAGATAASSISSMRNSGLSAHLVIDRDGTIYQCRPFNRTASHAGVSRWVDPSTGKKYTNLNSIAIGIEIANAGNDPGALKWARRQPGFSSIRAAHRNAPGKIEEWEEYPAAQIAAVQEASKAICDRYNLDDLTGHDFIAPERKNDPGPAFPMVVVRAVCGFKGLPTVHWK